MGSNPVSHETREKITKLWAKGYSAGKIAELLGDRTRNSVIGICSRMKLPSRPTDQTRVGYHRPKPKTRAVVFKETVIPKPQGDEPLPIGPINDFGTGCRWIAGDVLAGDWRTCGHTGFPYCDHHRSRCKVKPATRP